MNFLLRIYHDTSLEVLFVTKACCYLLGSVCLWILQAFGKKG
jgi:hypothetical protein